VPALTYSVHVDGDTDVVSTPGGAGGYWSNASSRNRLLEPILNVVSRSELMTDDLLLRVKYLFSRIASNWHSGHDNSALANLHPPREREVLAL